MTDVLEISRSRQKASEMEASENKPPCIVIVGGGFAGLAAVRALRGCDAGIVLMHRRNHGIFQPLLYQAATAFSLRPEAIRPKFLSAYEAAEQTDDPGERARQMTIALVGAGQTNWLPWIFAAKALVLWAVIAAATTEAARRCFVLAARQALARIAAPRQRIGLAKFDTVIIEALGQLKSGLRHDQPDDIVLVTLVIVAAACAGRYELWDYYLFSLCTRDGRVQA